MQPHPGQKAAAFLGGPAEDHPHAQCIQLGDAASVQGREQYRLKQKSRMISQRFQQPQHRAPKNDLFDQGQKQTAPQDTRRIRRGFARAARKQNAEARGQRRPQQRRDAADLPERGLFLFFLHEQTSHRRTLYHIRPISRKLPACFAKNRRNLVKRIDISTGHLVYFSRLFEILVV